MAHLARLIRESAGEAFEKQPVSGCLWKLYSTFRAGLLAELSGSAFADMFAQTLVYGLFAARYNHRGLKPFSRDVIKGCFPGTSPFLQALFDAISGPALDAEPFAGHVEELVRILAVTDVEALLADSGRSAWQENPLVHFYESFLVQYDPGLKELRGVYYTPEPVVSYIVRSVDQLLRTHFACAEGLADTVTVAHARRDESGKEQIVSMPRTLLLDPACGTGTFLYHVIAHIRERYRRNGSPEMWSGYVRRHLLPRLFGFELLMTSYAIAHLNLCMQLAALDLPPAERTAWAYDFAADERTRLYLTNTLEETVNRSDVMSGYSLSEEASGPEKIEHASQMIAVLLGNPPYAGHSANKGQWITDLLHGKDSRTGRATGSYFEVDGLPLIERNPKWLNDDYVKFIRFGQWRIEQAGRGMLAFVTNHGYLDNPTFRGMRRSLMRDFDEIYLLDLHGNAKKRQPAPGGVKDENVFDIQQGVAIGLFVRYQQPVDAPRCAKVYHADLWGPREGGGSRGANEVRGDAGETPGDAGEASHHPYGLGKYRWLAEHDVTSTNWTPVRPEKPFYLFVPQDIDVRAEYERGYRVTDLLPINVLGFQTHRDHFAIDFDKDCLRRRIQEMRGTRLSDQEYEERYGLANRPDWRLAAARRELRLETDWQERFISCLYRPFDYRFCYFSASVMDRPRRELLDHMVRKDNLCLGLGRQGSAVNDPAWSLIAVSRSPVDANIFRRGGITIFPLYLYPGPNRQGAFETGSGPGGRRPNLSSSCITDISRRLALEFVPDGRGDLHASFGPEDLFHYIYTILHSPTYRTRYAAFLKIDFPRVPLTSNVDLFRAACRLGEQLARLHLLETRGPVITTYAGAGENLVEKIAYREASGQVSINNAQYFEGVPPDVWKFRTGGFQVCHKWLKDRTGRALSLADIRQYREIIAALSETLNLMGRIDEMITTHGGWPIK